MMYFIPWVVFLLVVILSVPIVAWLEKRKMQAAYGLPDNHVDSLDDVENESDEAVESEEIAEAEPEEEVVDFGAAGDDFSEFEEIT